MAKDFIRHGSVVAIKQTGYDNWWTVLPNDAEPSTGIQVYVAKGETSQSVTDLITVLKELKKEASKA